MFSPEVVDRAVRVAFDAKDPCLSQWAAVEPIAGKIGCPAETLRRECAKASAAAASARV